MGNKFSRVVHATCYTAKNAVKNYQYLIMVLRQKVKNSDICEPQNTASDRLNCHDLSAQRVEVDYFLFQDIAEVDIRERLFGQEGLIQVRNYICRG